MPCSSNDGPTEKHYVIDYLNQISKIAHIINKNNPTETLCFMCRFLDKELIKTIKNNYCAWAHTPLLFWYAEHLAKDFQNKESSQEEKDFAISELKRMGFKLTPYIEPVGFRVDDFLVVDETD